MSPGPSPPALPASEESKAGVVELLGFWVTSKCQLKELKGEEVNFGQAPSSA